MTPSAGTAGWSRATPPPAGTAGWSRAMTLTGPRFLAAWRALELGEPPVELQLRPPGRTIAERDAVYDLELNRLRECGLAAVHRTGIRPRARLTRAMSLLAEGAIGYDLYLSTGLVALGAADGDSGVVLVSTGDEVRLVDVRGPAVPAALVELIGPVRPGRARTVNVDAETLDRARALVDDGSVWTLADKLVELGTPRIDAHSLARMCTGVTRFGQIGAVSRTAGLTRRGRWVVGFHRSPGGDFLQLRKPTGSGRPHVTIAPVTAEGLLARVRELVVALPVPTHLR